MSRTKCVVIREELVALTGDYKRAIVLGQMIYWSERVKDRALFLEEEHQRCGDDSTSHGWFYKRAEDLSEETMMGVKPKAMREYVKHLVEQGWIMEQRPDRLDRTLHYRVNLIKINRDLRELGYSLKGCTTHRFLPMDQNETSTCEKEDATMEKERATAVKEATTSVKQPSNRVKRTLATSEKENKQSRKILDTQGVEVMNSRTEITTQRLQDSESTHTDYTEAVCVRIGDLFGKKLSKTKVRTLIDLAEREGVDLDQAIQNTYTYHTKVEKCRSLYGAIQYAIEIGGWEMWGLSTKKTPKPLPKAVQEQLDRKIAPREDPSYSEFSKAKARIRQKMEILGYIYDEEKNQWEDPEPDLEVVDYC